MPGMNTAGNIVNIRFNYIYIIFVINNVDNIGNNAYLTVRKARNAGWIARMIRWITPLSTTVI